MSFEYIRKYYGMPVRRGGRVTLLNLRGHKTNRQGRITSARGGYLKVVLDGEKRPRTYHPGTVTCCKEDKPVSE